MTKMPDWHAEHEYSGFRLPWQGERTWTLAAKVAHLHRGSPFSSQERAGALNELAAAITVKLEQGLRINRLEAQVHQLTARIEQVERLAAKQVTITSLAPEPFALTQPIVVSLEPSDEGYVASFYDAGVHASGDNEQEAIDNLKSLILMLLDSLAQEPEGRLGPKPARQLAVLRSFIRGS